MFEEARKHNNDNQLGLREVEKDLNNHIDRKYQREIKTAKNQMQTRWLYKSKNLPLLEGKAYRFIGTFNGFVSC